MFTYAPLQKMLFERKIKKLELMELADISTSTLAKLSKDEDVKLTTLVKICVALDCTLNDIVEIKKS